MEHMPSIARHVQLCFNSFHDARADLAKAEDTIRYKMQPWNINDEMGRFRLWCGNVAAHRTGRSSLDYRLREASHIRDRVVELLKNLESVIQEAKEIISGGRIPWEDVSDSESDSSSEEGFEEPNTTELQQLMSNVAEITTCLMRLSMAIRNPAPHDQFKESAEIDMSYFEAFDIDHVRSKFPQAEEFLVLRLGKAISRRRQYLRYRDEHQKKLKDGLEGAVNILEIQTAGAVIAQAPSVRFESTVASSIPMALKVPALMTHIDDTDYYEDALSQTSYASSMTDDKKLRPPPLPEQGQDGNPFECPLCFRFTSIRHASAWHKHVYRDLQPYRHATADTKAECPLCLQASPSLAQLRRHLGKHHEELSLFALPPSLKGHEDGNEEDPSD
ncbi:hypothetical protein K491DRAFT_652646, partial [Lophiostoma macrostomum CBS 122681]